jgi:hypothetical protein
MEKLTIKKLKEVIKKSGFKLIYSYEEKEYCLISENELLYNYERLVK